METCQHEVVNPNQGLLSFLYVHNEQSPAYIEPHWHRAVELSYTSKGSIDHFYIAGENFQTQSGQILVVNTQDIHSIRVLNYKEEPELALTITYPYPFLVGQYEDISHCQFDINHPETFSTQQKQAYNHLQDILEMIIRDFQADSPQKNLKLNLGILQVLDILVTSFLVDTVADVHKDNRLQIAERIKEIDSFLAEKLSGDHWFGRIGRTLSSVSLLYGTLFQSSLGGNLRAIPSNYSCSKST